MVVCPGVNDGDALDDTLLGILDRFPRARDGRRRAARRERPHHRARDARRTRARRPSGARHRRGWQARFVAALGRRLVYAVRRVLPPRRAPVPRARRRTTRSRSTRTASAWPARSRPRCAPRSPATTRTVAGTAHRLLRLGRRRAGRGLPRAARAAVRDATPVTLRSELRASGRDRHRRVRRARCSRRSSTTSLPRPRAACRCVVVDNRFFGGNIAVTGLLTGADVAPRARRRTPTARAISCPTSCCRTAASSTATTVADLPRPVEVVPPTARRSSPRSGRDARAGTGEPRSRSSRSSAARTSASRRSSTASSAGATRSSRRSRASRATARSSTPSGTGAASSSSTPAAGSRRRRATGGEPLARQVSRQAERAIADADVVLLVVDVTVGVTEEDARVARVLQQAEQAGARRREQGRRRAARGRHLGVRRPRPRRPVPGVGDARAGERRPARRGRRRAAARADEHRRPTADDAHLLGRDRGPAQRRQVDAVQPPRRRRALGRARRAGHDARLHRHHRRDRRRPAALRRHRGHAPAEPHRRAHRVLQPRARARRPSTAPTPRCS